MDALWDYGALPFTKTTLPDCVSCVRKIGRAVVLQTEDSQMLTAGG